MDCPKAQEQILNFYLEEMPAGPSRFGPTVEAHLSGCPDCARFAARQQAIDARLATAFVSPTIPPAFRSDLRKRIRNEPSAVWSDPLPDIVHFATCGIATVSCALLLPFDAATTVGAGATAALLTYILLSAVRNSFEDMEQPEW